LHWIEQSKLLFTVAWLLLNHFNSQIVRSPSSYLNKKSVCSYFILCSVLLVNMWRLQDRIAFNVSRQGHPEQSFRLDLMHSFLTTHVHSICS
jgi:hypothetical protein